MALLKGYLGLRGAGDERCMLTVGITGSRSASQFAERELKRILGAYGAVPTGSFLGRKWAANRFRAPYLRESLWALGYA
ncbi:hypothetical protein ACKI13_47735, partial [Streptomyces scabiei]